jgi:hypothetical protein
VLAADRWVVTARFRSWWSDVDHGVRFRRVPVRSAVSRSVERNIGLNLSGGTWTPGSAPDDPLFRRSRPGPRVLLVLLNTHDTTVSSNLTHSFPEKHPHSPVRNLCGMIRQQVAGFWPQACRGYPRGWWRPVGMVNSPPPSGRCRPRRPLRRRPKFLVPVLRCGERAEGRWNLR